MAICELLVKFKTEQFIKGLGFIQKNKGNLVAIAFFKGISGFFCYDYFLNLLATTR